MVSSTNPVWLLWLFGVMIGLFKRVGLRTNVMNTVVMVCQPDPIVGRNSKPAYGRRMTCKVNSHRLRQKYQVFFTECRANLRVSSLATHVEIQQVRYRCSAAATMKALLPEPPSGVPGGTFLVQHHQSTIRSRGAQGGQPISPTSVWILCTITRRTPFSSWMAALVLIHGVTNLICSSQGRHWCQDILTPNIQEGRGEEVRLSCCHFRPGDSRNRVQGAVPNYREVWEF